MFFCFFFCFFSFIHLARLLSHFLPPFTSPLSSISLTTSLIFLLPNHSSPCETGQHVALNDPQEGFVGLFEQHCNPAAVAQEAVDDATAMCIAYYGVAPEVVIDGNVKATFRYIPHHLRYIMFEVIKNSLRATINRFATNLEKPEDKEYPPVRIVIGQGKDKTIAIKVSDQGTFYECKGRTEQREVWEREREWEKEREREEGSLLVNGAT